MTDGAPNYGTFTLLFGLGNRSIWFWQFYSRIKEGAKHEDLKIQVCLKYEKERRNIKEPTHVLTIKFGILVKNEVSDFPDRNIWFLQL
jgi:hypothetical protein